jgi:hypothetical protein
VKTIETTAFVSDDRTVTLQLPPEVSPGPHKLVVVIEGPLVEPSRAWTVDDFPTHDAALTNPSFSMRREDLYGDDGR